MTHCKYNSTLKANFTLKQKPINVIAEIVTEAAYGGGRGDLRGIRGKSPSLNNWGDIPPPLKKLGAQEERAGTF